VFRSAQGVDVEALVRMQAQRHEAGAGGSVPHRMKDAVDVIMKSAFYPFAEQESLFPDIPIPFRIAP
jgi:hypothetical protein